MQLIEKIIVMDRAIVARLLERLADKTRLEPEPEVVQLEECTKYFRAVNACGYLGYKTHYIRVKLPISTRIGVGTCPSGH